MKRSYTLSFIQVSKLKSRRIVSRNPLSYGSSNSIVSYVLNAYNYITNTHALLCKRMHFLLLFFFISLTALKAQVTNTTVFPLNDYLTTENGSPYPVLVQSKLDEIDTTKFVNVMDYGAKGDGETWDDDAIEQAFNNARYGVIFPANRTFLVHKQTRVQLRNSITVYAYGATIKMDDFSKYSFLSLEYEEGSYHGTVIWLGGKLWGNKRRQSWPGSPTGNNDWEEDHGRFLGIQYAEFALVKDVTVIGPVMDGVGLESCKLAVIADSKAYGGAPIKYSEVQDQGTYFKCTRSGSQAFYCMNLDCDGGSIGVHYSTKEVEDNSLSVVTNSHFTNQSQDALHFEDCRKVFIYNSTVERDTDTDCQADVHISNRTEIASIKSCEFRNARVDFRNASDLKIGVIDDCQFVSEFAGKGKNKDNNDNGNGNGNDNDNNNYSLSAFLDGGATHCINSSFTGKTDDMQAWADNVQNCSFSNFSDLALRGSHVAEKSHFENGLTPVSPAKDGLVVNCTFDNVDQAEYKKTPDSNDWEDAFSSSIKIVSDKNVYLGTITCGEVDKSKDTKVDIGIEVGGIDIGVGVGFASTKSSADDNFNLDTSTATKQTISIPAESGKLTSNNSNATLVSQPIKLYPNPAVNEIHVALNDKVWGKTVLNIYDQQGRLVQSKTVNKTAAASVESLSINTLAAGTYVLRIANQHQESSLKFIVAK